MEIGGSFLIQVGVSLTELRLLKDAFSEGFPVEEVLGGLGRVSQT
jgi:hypothetical protein